jgi:hypothetical protein
MTPAEKREYIKNNEAKILPEVPGQCQDMDTEHLLVFGMPTMARQDNPDYLMWTVESMRQIASSSIKSMSCTQVQIFYIPRYSI